MQLTTVKNTLVRHLGLIHDDFSHRVTDIWLPFATIPVSVVYVATVALVFILNSSIDLTTSQALGGEFTNSFYLQIPFDLERSGGQIGQISSERKWLKKKKEEGKERWKENNKFKNATFEIFLSWGCWIIRYIQCKSVLFFCTDLITQSSEVWTSRKKGPSYTKNGQPGYTAIKKW